MNVCDERITKLTQRIDNPLPNYSKDQIQRSRKMQLEVPLPEETPVEVQASAPEAKLSNPERKTSAIVPPIKKTGPEDRQRNSGSAAGGQPGPRTPQALNPSTPQPLNPSPAGQGAVQGLVGGQSDLAYSIERPRVGAGETSSVPGLELITKRDISELQALHATLPKRIKGEDSSSDFEQPSLPLSSQHNKLTNYFKLANPKPATSKAEDFSSVEFKKFTESALPRVPATQFERLLSEKDREIAELNSKVQELLHFKQRARTIIASSQLSLENKRRLEARNWILAERQALGEFVTVREGARFKEVWVDGVEYLKAKEALARVLADKETLERRRKALKRKTRPGESCEKRESSGTFSGVKGCYFSQLGAELSDSNSFSVLSERGLEELREQLNSQSAFLAREETSIKEKLEALDRRKELLISTQKLAVEEENSRFGRAPAGDREPQWPLMNGRYQVLGLLGKGGFSEVYRGFDTEELRSVACKIHQMSQHWSESVKSNYIKHILRETNVHRSITHPNVVAHYDTVEIDSNSFCTVLEFCNGPDLSAYLKRHKTLSEREARAIIKQVFAALKFLGESHRKVIHYDLKPQNILFHNGTVKISDFGLCKVMGSNEAHVELTSQGVGTYWYLPPECFLPEGAKISTKVDVWSAGVVLFEMLFGFRPFGHEACQERIWKEGIMLKANSLDFPAKPVVSAEMKDFLRKCLDYNQDDRIDVLQAYNLLNR